MHWFENIFGVPWDVFHEGRFVFAGRIPAEYLVPVVLAFCAAAWFLYRLVAARTDIRSWRVILGLRVALIALLFFVLAAPALRTMRSRQEVFTAVLVDTSRSMGIADASPGSAAPLPRMEAARRILLGEAGKNEGLLAALNQSGKVLVYGFDEEVRRVTSATQLQASGQFTNIFRGIRDMDAELRGMPLGAVVLITDGCRNAGGAVSDAAALLKARGVPLYVVGVGNPNSPDDYEVVNAVAPRRVRSNSQVEVQVSVRHTGYNQPFDVNITRGDTPVVSRTVTPSGKTDLEQVKLVFTPDQKGTAVYRISIPPGPGEQNTDNNAREFTLEIQDDRLPVLYVEGSPRMEYRFLRRALAGDKEFRLVGLLRLGDNRFYLQGANEEESWLAKGFPTSAEQLYAFQAVILGDIEASYFTPEQLAMLEEFVSKRGGGLIMLGGVNSFGQGKYAGTPVAKMLPVDISADDGHYSDGQYKATITRQIGTHPVMRLSLDSEENRTLWSQAPPLVGITPVKGVKAGATALLTREQDHLPVFAVQNYGAGRVAAFTSGGSWYWRVSVPSSVEFHEKFWKQLVRWLAVGAQDRFSAETDGDVVAPGSPVTIRATALAKDLQPVNDASIIATVTDPEGNQEEIPLEWVLSEEGVYKARFTGREEGGYHVAVRAEGWNLKPVEMDFRVAAPMAEAADTALKESALRDMAKAANGRYFSLGEEGSLPGEVLKAMQNARFSGMSAMDFEIWDNPVILALIVGLLTAEWIVRRRSGLA